MYIKTIQFKNHVICIVSKTSTLIYSFNKKANNIIPLAFSIFDSKIICLYAVFIRVISLMTDRMVPGLACWMESDKEFDYIFLIIPRYLNLVINQWIFLLQIENAQVATTLKFWTDLGENICYFIEFGMKYDPLSRFKWKSCPSAYNFRIKVGNVRMVYYVIQFYFKLILLIWIW